MIVNKLHEKVALLLIFLILSNYLFLSLSFSQLIIKINFLFFLLVVVIFYLKNIKENINLKIFFFLILLISLGTPTYEWDARSIWLFHGKRIFYDNSIFSIADNYATFSHNDYPTLVPAFSASLALLVGHWNEIFPKIAFSFMFLPPLILSYSFFKKTQYLIFLSIVFFVIGKYLFNGWMDGIVAVYFCISSLLMYILILDENEIQYKNNYLYLLIALCFFISLSLTKNEGLALLLAIFSGTLLIKIFKKELTKNISKLFFLTLSFLPIMLWQYFCYSNNVGYNDYINSNFLINLTPRIQNIENYQLVSYFIFLNEKFAVCLFLFLISFWINWDKKIFYFISTVLLIYIFILFFIFMSTPYDLYWQLNSTAARVVKTLSFTLAFFALYNLRNWKKIY